MTAAFVGGYNGPVFVVGRVGGVGEQELARLEKRPLVSVLAQLHCTIHRTVCAAARTSTVERNNASAIVANDLCIYAVALFTVIKSLTIDSRLLSQRNRGSVDKSDAATESFGFHSCRHCPSRRCRRPANILWHK